MREKRTLFVILGIGAVILLIVLFITAKKKDIDLAQRSTEKERKTVELQFTPEVLEYDGRGKLDLLKGVRATTQDGEDVTDEVQAVLTAGGTEKEKEIRYSVFSEDGKETTKKRTLRMKGYTGPELTVEEDLEIKADDLKNLISILVRRDELKAEDGFGKDASGQVSWVRQRISEGKYEITFTLRNNYMDTVSIQTLASITGEVSDIELQLLETSVSIPQGSNFYPLYYVAEATDPLYGDISSRIEINSMVNTNQPGTYLVVYTLLSVDSTQKAEAALQVTVTGGNMYD